MATKQTLIALAFSVALATAAQAECLTDAQAADMVAHYVARTPAANPENLSDADGACSRAKLNQLLAQRVGKVIGYKAGLTNPAVQKRFNTDKPVWGKLYEAWFCKMVPRSMPPLAPGPCTRPTCWYA